VSFSINKLLKKDYSPSISLEIYHLL